MLEQSSRNKLEIASLRRRIDSLKTRPKIDPGLESLVSDENEHLIKENDHLRRKDAKL